MLSQLVAKALLKGGWGDSPSGAKGRSPSLPTARGGDERSRGTRRGLILHCFGVYRQTETVYTVFFYTISLNCSSVIIGTFSSFAFLFFPEFDVISLFIRKSVFEDTAEATFAPLASMKSFNSFLFFQI